MSTSDPLTDALNAGQSDPAPPTTWVVMQFGAGQRPHVACSTNLALAIAHFFELAHMIVLLDPEGEYQLAADDDSADIQGLSLFQGELLALVLQPAGGLVRHPLQPTLPSLPADSFEASAPLLLAALQMRKTLDGAGAARFLNSSVARSWSRDLDEAIRAEALTEEGVADKFQPAELCAVWEAISTARTMQCLVAPLA